jgi:UTP:GlnB (protein PII) uridylyltransferase
VLDGFDVDGSPEHGGFVHLEVRGPDRVGFLGTLLRILSAQGLVPREMWVATRYDEACDRFLLATLEGRSPTDEQRQALEAALEEAHRQRRQPLSA